MNIVCVGLIGLLGIAVYVLAKVADKGAKAIEANKKLIIELKEARAKYIETLKNNIELQQENMKLNRENRKLTDKYIDAKMLLEEHDVIFRNLQEDSMCLAKAEKALNEVYDALILNKEPDLFTEVISANILYDSASTNYYDNEAEEITISMFDDYENEQGKFMYEYLNDKFGVNLNGSDIRTNMIFTVLHELGHYVDYSNKKVSGEFEEYVESNWSQRLALEGMEYGIESWKAYREISTEAFADKWAVEFMIKYFPELV
jgi:Zn-dependent peptidase ImmA (M78 family)